MLGVVGFASQLPMLLLAPVAGVYADRWNRHRIMLFTQSLSMLQAFVVAWLVLTGRITVWQIVPLNIFIGCVNAFDMPARQAFLVEMIEDRADLSNAIALNSSMVNGARLVGPSIAGVIIALVGEGWCFMADGVSYLAVIASLLAMRVTPRLSAATGKNVLHDLADGLRYAFGFPPIRAALLLMALVSLMGMPYTVLLPVIAERTLHGGPHILGFLMGASGLGALCGALWLASRTTVVGLVGMIPRASAVFGLGLIAFGASRSIPLSVLVLVVVGAGFMIQMASCNTVIQTLVREDMRGRVMALYSVAFMGMVPFGSLLAGEFASRIGAPITIAGGGALCIVGAVAFWNSLPALREVVNPIYVELGLLPGGALGPEDPPTRNGM